MENLLVYSTEKKNVITEIGCCGGIGVYRYDNKYAFLIAGDLNQNVAIPGAVELAEENALPCSQYQPAIFNKYRSRITC